MLQRAFKKHARRWRTLAPAVFFLLALVLFGFYMVGNRERLGQLLQFSLPSIVWLLLLTLIYLTGNGLINYLFYRGMGVKLTLNEGVGLAAINTLANQLPFAGGLAAKGVYLKQKHQLSYTRFLSATLALYVCFVAANGVIGLAVATYERMANPTGLLPAILPLGFLLMAMSIFLFLFRPQRLPATWQPRGRHLLDGWRTLSQNPRLVVWLLLTQTGMTFVFAGRLWLAFRMVSQPVGLANCLLFSAATILSRLVSIAPGGLGVREGIVAGMAAMMGLDAGIAVIAVGIDRLISTITIMIMGSLYSYTMSRDVARQRGEQDGTR